MAETACTHCGAVIAAGKRFCGKCGHPLNGRKGDNDAMPSGQSSLHLDPDVLNAALQQFVNRPGGVVVSFQDGRFVIKMGGMTLAVDHLSIGANGVDVNLGVVKLK